LQIIYSYNQFKVHSQLRNMSLMQNANSEYKARS